jgi:hypothetical protein
VKKVLPIIIVCVVAAACVSQREYKHLDKNPHPNYVHYMEQMIAYDLNSDDSATALWANDFMKVYETNFKNYQPDIKVVKKLKKYRDSIEVKIIGGNWCSDTRREVPRMCKVLYYMGMPVDKLSYYKVDRQKKPLSLDFASTYTFLYVPTMVIYKNGKECGKIVETPRTTLEGDLLNLLKN